MFQSDQGGPFKQNFFSMFQLVTTDGYLIFIQKIKLYFIDIMFQDENGWPDLYRIKYKILMIYMFRGDRAGPLIQKKNNVIDFSDPG